MNLRFSLDGLCPCLKKEGSQCFRLALSSAFASCACRARGKISRSCRSTCTGGLCLARRSCFSSWFWSCSRPRNRLALHSAGSGPEPRGCRLGARHLAAEEGIVDSSGIVVVGLPSVLASFLAGDTAASCFGSLASSFEGSW